MNSHMLVVAGALSFFAAAMHIAIIFGGADWYRFFGAGEQMALMAEHGNSLPTFITLGIATVLAVWGAYAWSGAGLLPGLPLQKTALFLITSVYLLRGALGLIAPFVSQHPKILENSTAFWVYSSLICLFIGLVHLKGMLELKA